MNIDVLSKVQAAIAAHAVPNAHGEQDKYSLANHDEEHQDLINYKKDWNALNADEEQLGSKTPSSDPINIPYANDKWLAHEGAAGGRGSDEHDPHQDYATEYWVKNNLSAKIDAYYDEGPNNFAGKDLVDSFPNGITLSAALDDRLSVLNDYKIDLQFLQNLLNTIDDMLAGAADKAYEISQLKEEICKKRQDAYAAWTECESELTELENQINS